MARGRTMWVAAAVVACIVAVVPASASTAFVRGQGFSWNPQSISILPGDTVDWANQDNVTHSITQLTCPRAGGSGACLFDTEVDPGEHFSYTFSTPGVYDYECAIHIFFGTINVLGPSEDKPDLVVSSVTSVPASATAPFTLRLNATVTNISSAAGAGRSDVVFQYRAGEGGEWHLIGTALANAVPIESSTTVRLLWDATGKIGDFEIRAIADGLGQVAEDDEGNNVLDGTASVFLPPGVLSPGVDLTEGV